MRHGSVFTGIGLLDLGLVLAGLSEPVWVCERDDWRRDTILRQRFPGAVRHSDVRDVGAEACEPIDMLVGGFPCKGASTAGKRNGFDHAETVLWHEMARAVGELRPRVVVVENVANILALHDGAVWGTVLGDLAALGYDTVWDCIPAAAVGAPHRRDRVFAVACLPDRLAGEAPVARDRRPGPVDEPGPVQRPVGPDRLGACVLCGDPRDTDCGHPDCPIAKPWLYGWPDHAANPDDPRRDERGRTVAGAPQLPTAERAGQDAPDPDRDARRLQPLSERGRGGPPAARTAAEAPANPSGLGRPGQRRGRTLEQGQCSSASDGARGVPVDWGAYQPGIDRWAEVVGAPPEPLVRRVDDRRAAGVERSRLSALGDGVQVQVGRVVGDYILSLGLLEAA